MREENYYPLRKVAFMRTVPLENEQKVRKVLVPGFCGCDCDRAVTHLEILRHSNRQWVVNDA